MNKIKNECVECGAKWKVTNDHHLHLDSIDIQNVSKWGQLYSICDDCSVSGECESVEQ